MTFTMTNEFDSRVDKDSSSLTELELLEALLIPDDATYPWNPADPESEAYFVEQEQQFLYEDGWEEEIANGAPNFFAKIEKIWIETGLTSDSTNVADVKNLEATLQQRATYIPQEWLSAIAHKAYQVLTTQKSMADQLVQCVQELLPNWAEDDLLVLARPFAYNMRGADTAVLDSALSNVHEQEWTALSEIEQVRASLAIARYALTQIKK